MKEVVIQFTGPEGDFWVRLQVPEGVPFELIEAAARQAYAMHQQNIVKRAQTSMETLPQEPSSVPVWGPN